ncbi:hypothetical protein BGX29_011266 [Mortierella sp. GBA35]|nr:hypothetical protein BGX29_011266 [Mortierella sp. GBA35]
MATGDGFEREDTGVDDGGDAKVDVDVEVEVKGAGAKLGGYGMADVDVDNDGNVDVDADAEDNGAGAKLGVKSVGQTGVTTGREACDFRFT